MQEWTWERIAENPFFAGIPRELVCEFTHIGKCAAYRKKASVFRAGETVRTVYIVLEGEVMLYNLTRHGNRKIIFILGRGKLLNHNISDTRPVSVFCETVSPAVLLAVPLEAFQKAMERSPEGILVDLELTMTMLADLVGAPRETVSRACRNLSRRGLLIYRDRRFVLPDPDGLAAFYKV